MGKIYQKTSTQTISASDINEKLGYTTDDELSIGSMSALNLAQVSAGQPISFNTFHNKTRIMTGQFSSNSLFKGYSNSLGTGFGTITQNIISGDSNGWVIGPVADIDARIYDMYAYNSASGNVFYFKPTTTNGSNFNLESYVDDWTTIKIKNITTGTNEEVDFGSSYASFSSSNKRWFWGAGSDLQTAMGGTGDVLSIEFN